VPYDSRWPGRFREEETHLRAVGNFWLWLTGKRFRAFVHAPERMAAILEPAGLVRATRRETLMWKLDLYHKGGGWF
jgi:hypothetical protein